MDTSEATQALVRQYESLSASDDGFLPYAFVHFVRALRSHPALDGVVIDALHDSQAEINRLRTNYEQNKRSALELREGLAGHPQLGPNDEADGLAVFDAKADEDLELDWPEIIPTQRDPTPMPDLIGILQANRPTGEGELKDFRKRWEQLRLDHQQWLREYLFACHSGGPAVSGCEWWAEALVPTAGNNESVQFADDIKGWALANLAIAARTRSQLFHNEPYAREHEGEFKDKVLPSLRLQARLAYQELRARLGLVRSMNSVIDRYRARATLHDAARLRDLAKKKPRAAEAALTADLARYLHDEGLNPLTEVWIGRLRADLLDPSSPGRLYVEAKQYTKSDGRDKVLQGHREAWDQIQKLRGTVYEPRDAYLVIFRRSGPLYQLPAEVRFQGTVLRPRLVDIAEPSETGSRQKHGPSKTIREEDLIPEPEGNLTPSQEKTPSKKKAPPKKNAATRKKPAGKKKAPSKTKAPRKTDP